MVCFIIMNLFNKLVVALVLLVPSAFLFSLSSYSIALSVASVRAGSDLVTFEAGMPPFPLFLASWAVPLLWVMVTESIERTVARACWVFSIAGFQLPISAFAFMLLAYFYPSRSDWFVFFVAMFIGVPLGTLGLALALKVSPWK